jgi:diguanylate cyclase (GGDEF)-like protein
MPSFAAQGDVASVAPGTAWLERDASGRQAMLAGILAEVSNEALQGDTLEDVLQRIVDCLARQLPVAIASIILLNESGTHFVEEVWSGDLDLDQPSGLPWPIGIGAAGRCVRSGNTQLIADVDRDPDYVAGHRAVRSEYLVPIRHRTRLHGVLNLESTREDFFRPEVCAVFDAVAAQIAGAIHLARVVRELEVANRHLRLLSMSDGLTGIANRRSFDEELVYAWRRHAQSRRPLSLLLVDVDHFKPLNDAAGHLRGDACLRAIAAQCLVAAPGATSMVARFGGDEFALLLPDCEGAAARALAERLRRLVESDGLPHPDGAVVTVSIGVATLHARDDEDAQRMIAAADRALYAAKAQGRNRVCATGDGDDARTHDNHDATAAAPPCSGTDPLLR